MRKTLAIFLVWGASAFGALPFPIPDGMLPFLADAHYLALSRPTNDAVARFVEPDLRGGKKIRPILCFIGGGILGRQPSEVVRLACLVEHVHRASLLADDVIDGATERRAEPTYWKRSTVTQAVLASLSLTGGLMLEAEKITHGAVREAILKVILEMVDGEFLQAAAIANGTYTVDEWNRIARAKTGALFGLSLSIPARHDANGPRLIRAFDELGARLGRLFQLQDDLQDAATEVGEVNYALLTGSLVRGSGSPFAALDAADVSRVRERVARELTKERADLLDRLREILSLADGMPKGDLAFRESCTLSLTALIELLTTVPK